jgi:hypothetical protein
MKLADEYLKMHERSELDRAGDAEPGLTAAGPGGHKHGFEVDTSGNGRTISTEPKDHKAHEHKIVGWKVSASDGHTHDDIMKKPETPKK